jgi:hypothetical protein
MEFTFFSNKIKYILDWVPLIEIMDIVISQIMQSIKAVLASPVSSNWHHFMEKVVWIKLLFG